jgi:hypothetical protein
MTAVASAYRRLACASEFLGRAIPRATVRKFVSAAIALAIIVTCGCASPLTQAWVGHGDPEIEAVAADNSFPSAAEAGLASADAKADRPK